MDGSTVPIEQPPARSDELRRWLGIQMDEAGPPELLLSGIGAAVAIGSIYLISHHLLGLDGALMLVASMAASAVLVFAAPHGQLSQPWPVVVGQMASAAVGVTCARWIGATELAAMAAVGLSVVAMRALKALHPPGGATALIAVVGGDQIRALGYRFLLEPVLLNCMILVAVGVALNLPFRERRYPAHLAHRADTGGPDRLEPTYDELLAAVRELDGFVDVTEDDLIELHRIFAADRAPSAPSADSIDEQQPAEQGEEDRRPMP